MSVYYCIIGSSGWTVPVITGTTPPPTVDCTLCKLPSQDNKAILFGGVVADGSRVYHTNEVYMITLSKRQVVSC